MTGKSSWICPRCHLANLDWDKTCHNCGADRETLVGKVTRVFPRLQCVGIKTNAPFARGSTLKFVNAGVYDARKCLEYLQTADSVQINHQPVEEVDAGQLCAVRLNLPPGELPRYGTEVYLVPA